ncbi:ABC transporter permease subunit [Liberibacter sp. Z1]|nr:ABC transporter permease subunit [Candidatus Liberibacter sp.]
MNNISENMAKANASFGFGFLNGRAGFQIDQGIVPYTNNSSYFMALIVGLCNTLTVAILGIIPSTLIGILVGTGRLSSNKLVSWICRIFVEIFRNIPPLVVIFFWYKAVLSTLPGPHSSITLPFGIFLNNRGLSFPKLIIDTHAIILLLALLLGIVLSVFVSKSVRKFHEKTGHYLPNFRIYTLLILGLPIVVFYAGRLQLYFDTPKLGRFNFEGGATISPEFISLYMALSFYTASFIAEIVRSGISAVPRGQVEAATALGLSSGQAALLVIIPQAMRAIIPPLTSQYLNLLKNSSLAVAVGFSDLVSVGGTILNQTGQAVEIVVIWMSVYFSLSIIVSLFMNWFNAKVSLVER